ncbi:MAG: replication initiator protein A [Alphaproteobacteria bacterium GM202ARS2]|nr:replication initiator protein A [Alphaproteobacteria bacterium GM202ARS2]
MTQERALAPIRHSTDFFLCDIFDATPKADMPSMSVPLFSLSTRPDHEQRRYDFGNNRFVKIIPSGSGAATVHDRDILIYAISQIIAAKNAGRTIGQKIRFHGYDLLVATNRQVSGEGYAGMKAALDRLAGTRIETNVLSGGLEVTRNFGLVDEFEVVKEHRDGRMLAAEIKLSDWTWAALEASEVLTLHRDYFRLRKPLERRLYELARKHCGKQPRWHIGLEKLQQRTGSKATRRQFRQQVRKITDDNARHSHMPDYSFSFDDDVLTVKSRSSFLAQSETSPAILLSADTYERARALTPGWDITVLESEWRDWSAAKDVPPHDPDAAFLAFCRKKGPLR